MRYTQLNEEDVTKNPQWNGFIGQNKKNQIISFRKIYFDLTQDIETAILLEEICYWYGKPIGQTEYLTRLRIKQDGFLWLAKRKDDWYDLIRLTLRKYDRAIRKLKKLNFIETKVTRYQGKSQTLIRLTNLFIEEFNREINIETNYTTNDVIDTDAKAHDMIENSNRNDLNKTIPDRPIRRSEQFLIDRSVDQTHPDRPIGRSLYTSPLLTTPLNNNKEQNFSKYKIGQEEELQETLKFYKRFWVEFEAEFSKSAWSLILKSYNAIPNSDIRLSYFLYLLNIDLNETSYFQVFDLWEELDCTNINVKNSYNKFIALIFTKQKKLEPIVVSTVEDVKSVIYALHNFMKDYPIDWPGVL